MHNEKSVILMFPNIVRIIKQQKMGGDGKDEKLKHNFGHNFLREDPGTGGNIQISKTLGRKVLAD
jgi:hypothetical protein